MKKRILRWWFERVIRPYMLKHRPECCAALIDSIVFQMWYGGIGLVHINKWLVVMGHKTIKAYVMEGPKRDQLRLLYDYPDAEKRKSIVGNLVIVEVR